MSEVSAKTRIGLLFDDGFVNSTLATAELFESFGLRAGFCVLANPAGFAPQFRVGDFGLWNELKSRGHRIHPHGYTHANLAAMSYPDATAELEKCLATFNEKLHGFDASRAVFCFAYNSGTPALCQWLLTRVGAARIGGSGLLSAAQVQSRVWHSRTFGPGDPGADLLDTIAAAQRENPAAVLYVLHGLDGEAWGAIARQNLCRTLELILADSRLEYWNPSP